MTWMTWSWALNVMGQTFALAGLATAIAGLAGMKKELFPAYPMPHERAIAWIRRLVRRRSATVQLSGTMSGSMTATGNLSVEVIPARPNSYEPDAQWIRHFDERLKSIDAWRTRYQTEAAARFASVEQRIATETAAVSAKVTDVENKFSRALGGREGKGLDVTFWGLAITLFGVLLQIIALGLDAHKAAHVS